MPCSGLPEPTGSIWGPGNRINFKAIDISESDTEPGLYETAIKLNDEMQFPQIPTGSISIRASNRRAPQPVEKVSSFKVLIDGDGPTIAIQEPLEKKIVGGTIKLVFTASDGDGAGVDEKTVSVSGLGGKEYLYDPEAGWSRNNTQFTFEFDSTNPDIVGTAQVQLTLNVRAKDLVGNPTTGQSRILYLDNVPPSLDLDPANIRVLYSATDCTGAFDPVGDKAVNDLAGVVDEAAVSRIAFFRGLIYDRTNEIPNQTIFYHAGVDAAQVRLYVQHDPDGAPAPLLVDETGDGLCDEIGAIDDINLAPKFVALNPLFKAGQPLYKNDPGAAPAAPASCVLTSGTVEQLCRPGTSDMWQVVVHDRRQQEPLIYVVGQPGGTDDPTCTGSEWEFGAKEFGGESGDGWVCLAARAVDNAGNVGVSRPLRVCMDDLGIAGQPPCRVMSTIPPACTDGCTPPPRSGGFHLVQTK